MNKHPLLLILSTAVLLAACAKIAPQNPPSPSQALANQTSAAPKPTED